MEPFPYLPVELVDLIVSLADKKEKYTLALVQRSWFKMFARVDKLWSRGTITEANFAAFLTAKVSVVVDLVGAFDRSLTLCSPFLLFFPP